jgi:Fe-S cluster biogenesis protein NfuA
MAAATREQLIDLCRDVLAPLVRADGGELFVVSVGDDALALHLGGLCSGCPGAPLTSKTVIEPIARRLSSSLALTVTAGALRPPGAMTVEQLDGKADGGPAGQQGPSSASSGGDGA